MPGINLTVSDPVTAIAVSALQALTAYFNFLATPEGQKFAGDARQLIWDRLVALIPKVEVPHGPAA